MEVNNPDDQVEWLRADRKATTSQTIVFAQQRLDVKNDRRVKYAVQVRRVFEDSGRLRPTGFRKQAKDEWKT